MNLPNGKENFPIPFRLEKENFPDGFSGKLLFHLTCNRNFRILWLMVSTLNLQVIVGARGFQKKRFAKQHDVYYILIRTHSCDKSWSGSASFSLDGMN